MSDSKLGHNSVGAEAAGKLRSYIERWEHLEAEKKAISDDQKDLMTLAKGDGFDVKVVKQIIRMRKQEPAEVEEQETLLSIYRRALGMGG